jgi:signal peptide peptidase SppA
VKSLAHLYTRIFDVPLAVHQGKFDAILGAIGERLGIEPTAEQIDAAANSSKAKNKGYAVQDGIAVIPVTGSLMKTTSGMFPDSGATSYQTLGTQYADAMRNKDIKGILLDVDSPGGETSGLFELCDLMASFQGQKPVYAVSNDGAFSAAYAIACVADKLFVTRTGGVGSIGVICAHLDVTQADQMAGKKYTFIHAGAKKADGNPHAPLSDTAFTDTQAEVFRLYQMFVSLVAKNRDLTENAVRDTEAGVLFGETAVPLLADAVGTVEDAFAALSESINTTERMQTTKLNKHSVSDLKDLLKTLSARLEDPEMAKKLDIDELIELEAKKKADDEEMKDCDAADDKKTPVDDNDDDDDDQDDDDDDEKDSKKGKSKSKSASDAVQIAALCELQGVPHLTSKFLSNGNTLAEVTQALLKQRATKPNVKVASSTTVDPAVTFRNAYQSIMSDDKPNKAERYAAFVGNHRAEFDAYNKTRKGAKRSADVI